MKDRAQELYDFLGNFVHKEHISLAFMTISGWSFGSVFVFSLFAHAPSFALMDEGRPLTKYIERVMAYGKFCRSPLLAPLLCTSVISTLLLFQIRSSTELLQPCDARSCKEGEAVSRVGLGLLHPRQLALGTRVPRSSQRSASERPSYVSRRSGGLTLQRTCHAWRLRPHARSHGYRPRPAGNDSQGRAVHTSVPLSLVLSLSRRSSQVRGTMSSSVIFGAINLFGRGRGERCSACRG